MKAKKLIALTIAAGMAMPCSAMADANLDELNSILAQYETLESKDPMAEALGMEQICSSLGENGGEVALQLALTPETVEMLGLTGSPLDGAYATVAFDVNKAAQKWALSFIGAQEENELLSGSIMGSADALAVKVPQFLDQAIAVKAGDIKEQLLNSVFGQMVGLTEETLASVPNINISFYPNLEEMSAAMGENPLVTLINEYSAKIEEQSVCEKTEEDGKVIYTVKMPTSAVIELYQDLFGMLPQYAEQLQAMGADVEFPTEDEIQELLATIQTLLGDEIDVNFVLQDNQLEGIVYSLTLTNAMVQNTEEGSDPEAVAETIDYSIVLLDPADPNAGVALSMTIAEGDSEDDVIDFQAIYTNETTDTRQEASLYITTKQGSEVLYEGTPLVAVYDAEANTFNAEFTMDSEGEIVKTTLDSVFADVVPGESFVWTINELGIEADGAKLSATGNVFIDTGVAEFNIPEDAVYLLEETDQETLQNVVGSLMTNVMTWTAQFSPEPAAAESEAADMTAEAVEEPAAEAAE